MTGTLCCQALVNYEVIMNPQGHAHKNFPH